MLITRPLFLVTSHRLTRRVATRSSRRRRYEGEFHMGFIQGLGQYTGNNGEVYRGEWLYGMRHGCTFPP